LDLINALVDSYQQQLGWYQQLQALTVQQKQAICADDTAELNRLIEAKQAVITQISKVQAQTRIIADRIKTHYGIMEVSVSALRKVVAASLLQPLQEVLAKIRQVMEAVLALEQENEALLRAAMGKVQQQIGELRNTKTANKAYQQAGYVPPGAYFIDKKK